MFLMILKIAFLFMTVLFTLTNVIRTMLKNNVPAANMFFQTIGITGFIVLQWLV